MIDPDFDPLEQLVQITATLNQLIQAHNRLSDRFILAERRVCELEVRCRQLEIQIAEWNRAGL